MCGLEVSLANGGLLGKSSRHRLQTPGTGKVKNEKHRGNLLNEFSTRVLNIKAVQTMIYKLSKP